MNLPAETLFAIANTLVLPGWLLLLIAPGWPHTRRVVMWAIVLPLSLLYVFVLVSTWGQSPEGANFGSLHGLALLFSRNEALLAGWVHYLAFDLFTGLWIATDARQQNFARWVVAPALLLTFLVGPAGWLLYAALKTVKTNRPKH